MLEKKAAVQKEEEERDAGYKLWLASDPKCQDEDYRKSAPTTWNVMREGKKRKWIEGAKLDPAEWRAKYEEEQKVK